MTPILQEITLKSDLHFGRRLPPSTFGKALVEIPIMVRSVISMAFRGHSSVRGIRPGWLTAAVDIRFVGHGGTDESVLQFEIPRLGEAAVELERKRFAVRMAKGALPRSLANGLEMKRTKKLKRPSRN